jgi:hypothetical protein
MHRKAIWALRKPAFIAMVKIAMVWQPFIEITLLNFNSICHIFSALHKNDKQGHKQVKLKEMLAPYLATEVPTCASCEVRTPSTCTKWSYPRNVPWCCMLPVRYEHYLHIESEPTWPSLSLHASLKQSSRSFLQPTVSRPVSHIIRPPSGTTLIFK